MSFAAPSTDGPSLSFIEGALTFICVGLAFAFPAIGKPIFVAIERTGNAFARHKLLSGMLVGLALLGLRLAMLPWLPIPLPYSADDFSFALAADTFLHGRLTNPTPAMWVHFETIHVDMRPTYMSMYFPGQALAMAAGKLLFGHPWFGLLAASAVMCSSVCWALQAWLPARWALLGGTLCVVHLGLFTYWTNTFGGSGSISAAAGAMVFGALPRFTRGARLRYAMLMALGAAVLLISRPYEGFLLCLPVVIYLIVWLAKARAKFGAVRLARAALPALTLLCAAAVWLGYYNHRVFGNPLTLPYTVNRANYAVAPYYIWQSPRAVPQYNHEEMRRFYLINELDGFKKVHSAPGLIPQTLLKPVSGFLFFGGLAFIPLVFLLRRSLRDRRMRFIAVCLAVLTAGLVIEIYFIPHYIAPFTVGIYLIAVQCMRHLRQWRPGDKQVGLALSRFMVAICLFMAVLRVFDRPLHLEVVNFPPSNWTDRWYGPDLLGVKHAEAIGHMNQLPGRQLALVRRGKHEDLLDQWVYNSADIDTSKVIWAWDMGPEKNRELLDYYKDRKVWLVQPDTDPVSISPYR